MLDPVLLHMNTEYLVEFLRLSDRSQAILQHILLWPIVIYCLLQANDCIKSFHRFVPHTRVNPVIFPEHRNVSFLRVVTSAHTMVVSGKI